MAFKSVRLFSEIHYIDSDTACDPPDEQHPASPEMRIPSAGVSATGELTEDQHTVALRVETDTQEIVVRVEKDGVFVTRGEMTIWVHENGEVSMWPRQEVPPEKRVGVFVEPDGECSLNILNFARVVADQEGFSISAFPSVKLRKIGEADAEISGLSSLGNNGRMNVWRLEG